MANTFKQISAGYSRSLALLQDNTGWAWGNVGRSADADSAVTPWAAICGSSPQEIGHNRFAQPLPQLLNPDLPYLYLTDAINGLMALDIHGQVDMVASSTSLITGAAHAPITGIASGMKQICANETASYALDSSGKVWSWGSNFQGQLGRQSDAVLNQPPAKIETLPKITHLATGKNHTLALSDRGEVWAWGANAAGQLGQGNLKPLTTPARVLINTAILAIAAGDTHSLAIDANGHLYAWGSHNKGQLGPIMSSQLIGFSASPLRVKLGFKLKQVDAGMHYTIALSDQGELYAWGWNGMGQLGESAVNATNRATKISDLKRVREISAGAFHALALNDRGLYAWGDNRNSACGISSAQAEVVKKPNLISFA
jgi:alpha-tubulin suppressor-like RCC1 family protein